MTVAIRHGEPDDYDRVIGRVDTWWGGRRMASMLPRLFFTYFRPWTFVAVHDDPIIGFLAGFQSQTNPRQATATSSASTPTGAAGVSAKPSTSVSSWKRRRKGVRRC